MELVGRSSEALAAVKNRVKSALKLPVRMVRRCLSGRQVVKVHAAVRGGNILYLWQEMFLRDQRGTRAVVTSTAAMQPWLDEFPLLRPLTIDEADMNLLDEQLFMYPRRPGVDFALGENSRFCRALVASSPRFRGRRERLADVISDDTCVVNVRRGDYYTVPANEARFGLDIVKHIERALHMVRRADRPVEDIVVISDDVQWCIENLSGLLGEFRVLEERTDMFDDLAALSSARTVILANSTFSYWGAFLAEAFHPETMVIAPPFHERDSGGAPLTLEFSPRWVRTT